MSFILLNPSERLKAAKVVVHEHEVEQQLGVADWWAQGLGDAAAGFGLDGPFVVEESRIMPRLAARLGSFTLLRDSDDARPRQS